MFLAMPKTTIIIHFSLLTINYSLKSLGGQKMNINDMWREFEQTGSVKAYLLYKNKEKLMYEMAKEPLEENTEVEE
jgi:hypothetical protein